MDANEIRLMAKDFPPGKLREALLIAARATEAVKSYKALEEAAREAGEWFGMYKNSALDCGCPECKAAEVLRLKINAALAALPVEEEGVTGVCPNCNGSKTFPALIGPDAGAIGEADCDYCGGSGYITDAALPLVKALEDADYAYREAYIGYRDVERRIRDDARRALTEYNARKAGEFAARVFSNPQSKEGKIT